MSSPEVEEAAGPGAAERDRWDLLGRLFDRALDLTPEHRLAWLAEECAGDPGLERELAGMLAAHDRAEGILERPLAEVAPAGPTLAGTGFSALDGLSGLGGWTGGVPLVEEADRSGEEVGPYRLVREIGRGGMGVVYQARDTRLDRFVALKFLPSAMASKREAHSRFLAEAKAASALDHPSICTVYDLGDTPDGQLYIAMAFYPGETLAVRLTRGALPVREALRLARQIAGGLACAHEAGIVHRDIKPSNLLVTDRGEAKILDFGVAKLEGGASLTLPGSLVGTITYMAPEQITGEEVDARSDLWALGAVLYEMLAGRRPFEATNPAAALEAILGREPELLRAVRTEVPPPLEAIVHRLLAKSPKDRIPSAAELVRELDRLDAERETSTGVRAAPIRGTVSATPMIGRSQEVDRGLELLSKVRLLTLTGPAGTGKTRLALEIARQTAGFPGGVVFVPLAELRDADLVPSALASALGVAPAPAQPILAALRQTLGHRALLLILDSFEHLASSAPVLAELLASCPGVKMLVTSRVALRLSAEHEMPVTPLALPETGPGVEKESVARSSAVELFVERARAARPGFRLTDTNVHSVAEIAVRLDGLPLALELAAAWIKLFPPKTLLERLGKGLDLLSGGALDLPPRHRTLRQALDWSYRLLDPEEQRFFRRLSVFAGGFPLEAAEAVCSGLSVEPLRGLSVLVDQSLLQREEREEGEDGEDGEHEEGRPEFSLLAIVRAFAFEKLVTAGEEREARRAHAEWYLAIAEQAESALAGPETGDWLDRLESIHGHLRAALDWAEERGETAIGLRLAAALWRFWLVRGHLDEGCRRLRRLLELPDPGGPSALRARALNGLGTLSQSRGDSAEAHSLLAGSLALYRYLEDRRGVARVLNNLAWLACERSELATARAVSEEALALYRKLDDPRGVAVALGHLGWVANLEGDTREARRLARESLDLRRTLGDPGGIVFALTNLAWVEQIRGDLEEAEQLLDQACERTEEMGDLLMRGFVRLLQGRVWRDRGRGDQAAEHVEKGLVAWRRAGHRSGVAWALCDLAHVLLDLAKLDEAGARLDEGLEIWRSLGSPWGEALGLLGLARLGRARGRPGAGWRRLREYLAVVVEIGARRALPPGFELGSGWLAEEEPERSARLLAAAQTLREELETPLPPRLLPVRDALEEVLREALGDRGFEQARSAGRTMGAEAAVAALSR